MQYLKWSIILNFFFIVVFIFLMRNVERELSIQGLGLRGLLYTCEEQNFLNTVNSWGNDERELAKQGIFYNLIFTFFSGLLLISVSLYSIQNSSANRFHRGILYIFPPVWTFCQISALYLLRERIQLYPENPNYPYLVIPILGMISVAFVLVLVYEWYQFIYRKKYSENPNKHTEKLEQ